MTKNKSIEAQLSALTAEVTSLKERRSIMRHQRALNGLAIAYAKRGNTEPVATPELKNSDNEHLKKTLEAKDEYLKLLAQRDGLSRNVPLPRSTIEKRLHHLFKALARNTGPSGVHPLETEQRMAAEFFEFQELHRKVDLLDVANRELTEQRSTLQANVAALNKEQRQRRREEQNLQRTLDVALENARALRRSIGRQQRSRPQTVSVEASETLMAKFKAGDALELDEIQAMLEHSSLFQDPDPTEMTDGTTEA